MGYTDQTDAWAYKDLVTWTGLDAHAENHAFFKDYWEDADWPACSVYRGGLSQAINHNTWTKVQLNTEWFDKGSAFDATTNYRWTPGVVGYYLMGGGVRVRSNGGVASNVVESSLYKNGGAVRTSNAKVQDTNVNHLPVAQFVTIEYVGATTDYYELWGRYWDGVSAAGLIQGAANDSYTFFYGMRLL